MTMMMTMIKRKDGDEVVTFLEYNGRKKEEEEEQVQNKNTRNDIDDDADADDDDDDDVTMTRNIWLGYLCVYFWMSPPA